ncbi:MAG: hypothetical protein PHI68_05035 [Candidatus Cloacimonetes bacterium]|nr:hypothetical protein [Candidatus Cloacimonadota bacterium]
MRIRIADFFAQGQDLAFELQKGEPVLLIDALESSAEAILESLIGLSDALEGNIYLDDIPLIDRLSKESEIFGYVFDEGIMISNLSIRENLFLPYQLHFQHATGADFDAALQEWMKIFELDVDVFQRPAFVKPSYRKLFCFIRVLLLKPPILLLDNPLYLLNSLQRKRLIKVLEGLNQDYSMLIFSNDDEFRQGFCKQIITIPT